MNLFLKNKKAEMGIKNKSVKCVFVFSMGVEIMIVQNDEKNVRLFFDDSVFMLFKLSQFSMFMSLSMFIIQMYAKAFLWLFLEKGICGTYTAFRFRMAKKLVYYCSFENSYLIASWRTNSIEEARASELEKFEFLEPHESSKV